MFRTIIVKSNCVGKHGIYGRQDFLEPINVIPEKGSYVKVGKMPFAEKVERVEFDYESKTIKLYVKG